jgi:hypothetical protein
MVNDGTVAELPASRPRGRPRGQVELHRVFSNGHRPEDDTSVHSRLSAHLTVQPLNRPHDSRDWVCDEAPPGEGPDRTATHTHCKLLSCGGNKPRFLRPFQLLS